MKKPAKAAKPKAFKPVPVSVQRRRHVVAVRHFKPVPVKVQVARHKAAAARAKHHKKVRKLALGEGVACCAAEALAASLRLAGYPVADEDVLALYFNTASGPDDGASISATVGAAQSYGLAGCRVAGFGVELPDERLLPFGQGSRDWQHVDLGKVDYLVGEAPVHGLILGVDLPGPHAVLATPDGWWSWGELHDPAEWPHAVIEEAWQVTWQ